MKRILFLLLVAASVSASAQSSKVVSAYNAMKAAEFDKAAEYIDVATLNEKTMGDEKTWRYRGQIYQQIAVNQKDFGITKDVAVKTALASFEKALQLDTKGRWEDENTLGRDQCRNIMLNMGIEAYNEKDYGLSRDMFMGAAEASERSGVTDTLAIYNAGLAAEQAEDYTTALTQYGLAAEKGYLGAQMYVYIANVYTGMEDTEGYLKTIQDGRVKYPEDADLIVYELNYYLKNGQYEEAENNLKLAIAKEPDNKQLHFSLGVVYDNLGQTDKAAMAYQDAINVDGEYFDAVYNMGALYFNNGVEMNNAANEIEDNTKYQAKKDEAKASFVTALPFLEKAHELDSKDLGAMQSLKTLYASIGETEKYKAIKAEMDNL